MNSDNGYDPRLAWYAQDTTVFAPPAPVAEWSIDNFEVRFSSKHYPNWFHRKVQKLLLGIDWRLK